MRVDGCRSLRSGASRLRQVSEMGVRCGSTDVSLTQSGVMLSLRACAASRGVRVGGASSIDVVDLAGTASWSRREWCGRVACAAWR